MREDIANHGDTTETLAFEFPARKIRLDGLSIDLEEHNAFHSLVL